MATAIEEFCGTIRGWLNLGPEVYPNSVVTSWVRMAEEFLSENLRVKHMIQIDWQDVIASRVLLPSDWQQLDTVRFRDGIPLVYMPRDEFYKGKDVCNRYTIVGNYILLGTADPVAGTEVEISYYQNIPPLDIDPNWLLKYYSRLYILTTCWHAAMYAIEDERGPKWQNDAAVFLNDMNSKHFTSKASGSILVRPRRKGFG